MHPVVKPRVGTISSMQERAPEDLHPSRLAGWGPFLCRKEGVRLKAVPMWERNTHRFTIPKRMEGVRCAARGAADRRGRAGRGRSRVPRLNLVLLKADRQTG